MSKTVVTVKTTVEREVELVWRLWTEPEHVTQWNFASADWHCPSAESDLQVGGSLCYNMAAKDGSMAFDYKGTFTRIVPNQLVEHTIEDGREVSVVFEDLNGSTQIIESFEAENMNSVDLQRQGWQSILDNFKAYAEAQ